jgi:hypothetical protein
MMTNNLRISLVLMLLVDPIGLEPTTSAMSRQRSNQLSYGSIFIIIYCLN